MAYNGAGTFVRLYSWVADKASAIKINASRMDAEMDGFAAGLSNCITRDGQTTLTADIPFNSRKITGLGNATADGDALNRITADGRYAPLASGSLSGFRNRLINGSFQVNQRVVSGTVTLAAGAYGHDRWKAGASGCTYTFATSGNDTTITITSGSLVQVVEGTNIEGGVYALSWTGTATGRVAISGGSTTGAYAASPITTGSATGGQTITVEFTLGTLGKVQLETGAANTFERRPIGIERVLCHRYYQKSQADATAPGGGATVGAMRGGNNIGGVLTTAVRFTRMRTAPTIRLWDTAGNLGQVSTYTSGGTLTARAASASEITEGNCTVSVTTTDTTLIFQYDLSAEL